VRALMHHQLDTDCQCLCVCAGRVNDGTPENAVQKQEIDNLMKTLTDAYDRLHLLRGIGLLHMFRLYSLVLLCDANSNADTLEGQA